jgi:hypothetical protein
MLARIFEPEAFGIAHTKKQPPDPLKTIGVDCNGSFESDKKDNEHNWNPLQRFLRRQRRLKASSHLTESNSLRVMSEAESISSKSPSSFLIPLHNIFICCTSSREVQIKCDLPHKAVPCSRCKRSGLSCAVNKSLQMILEDDST